MVLGKVGSRKIRARIYTIILYSTPGRVDAWKAKDLTYLPVGIVGIVHTKAMRG